MITRKDDSWWIGEKGPFESYGEAREFYAFNIGPLGHSPVLPINDFVYAKKITSPLDVDVEVEVELSGMKHTVIKAYHLAGYYIAVRPIHNI